MSILGLILALSAGDFDLPVTLAAESQAKKNDLEWSIGPLLGVASSFDSEDSAFLIGGQVRVRVFPWLGLEASIDFQTNQTYEHSDIDVLVFPIQVSGLFYLPVEWPVKPYGVAGVDLAIVDVRYHGVFSNRSDKTVVEPGAHLGAGADYPITPSVTLDADFRFVFLAGTAAGDRFDYFQFTVGVNFKLP